MLIRPARMYSASARVIVVCGEMPKKDRAGRRAWATAGPARTSAAAARPVPRRRRPDTPADAHPRRSRPPIAAINCPPYGVRAAREAARAWEPGGAGMAVCPLSFDDLGGVAADAVGCPGPLIGTCPPRARS